MEFAHSTEEKRERIMDFKNIKLRIRVSAQNVRSSKLGQALICLASCIPIVCFGLILWAISGPSPSLIIIFFLLTPVWLPLMWIAGHGMFNLLEIIDEFYDFREKNRGKEEK